MISEPCKSLSACLTLKGGYIIEFQGDFKVVRDVSGALKKKGVSDKRMAKGLGFETPPNSN